MNPSREVAQLLIDWSNGDKSALDELFPIVMGELRRRAHNALRHERPGHTLQTTALIHETYIKLAGYRRPPCREQGHFFAIAAQAMRYVLVQHARNRLRAKRNGIKVPFETLDADTIGANNQIIEILALDEALKTLGAIDPLKLRLAEMKIFAGSGNQEVAEALGISLNQATRYWQFARAYLAREIRRREHDA